MNRKRLLLDVGLLLLTTLSLAQSSASTQSNGVGVQVTSALGVATFKNVGSSAIVALAAKVQLKGVGKPVLLRHDHYFKPIMAPGDTFDFDMIAPDDREPTHGAFFPVVVATVVWVQYADGSTWGDGSDPLIQEMISNRQEVKTLLRSLKAASSQTDFDAILANAYATPRSFVGKMALQIKGMEHDLGYNMAVTDVNDRLSSAQSHSF